MSHIAATPNAAWRIAVVGAGYFSQFHLEGWAQVAGAQVVALCDSDLAKAAGLAERFNIDKVYASVAEMLADLASTVDLFDVVTPPASHAAVLAALFEQRRPIICQKPFGANYAQAQALTAAALANGSQLIVHENFRFMPWYREIKRCIETGLLGDLHGVSFRLRTGDGQGTQAYLDRQPYFQTMPRLLVAETAIHFIDTFRYLLGEVTAVYARLRKLNPAIAGEDAGIIIFEFASGAAGVFDGNRLNEHPARNQRRTLGEMWLEGANGVMRLDGDARLWWQPHHGREAVHVYAQSEATSFGGGACAALQRHVIACLTEQRPCENNAQDYLRNLLIQEAVYASHATGRRVDLASFNPASHVAATLTF